MSEKSSPGYIESIGSTKRKTKEDLNIKQLIPSEILDSLGTSGGIENLLKRYYEFMNMDEFIYTDSEDFTDIILDGKAVFRIRDPEGDNNQFFHDTTGSLSTLKIGSTTIDLTTANTNIVISNGNDLPGSLANSETNLGKTYTINFLDNNGNKDNQYNSQSCSLKASIRNWVGPGPSYILNAIEEAMDIDKNDDNYLAQMQKEIAASIPKDLTVNKRSLYKQIVDFYKIRGSDNSIEIFFRLLFNDDVEVEYPWDNTLIPSAGTWNAGVNQFSTTTGFISEKDIRIHDSNRYQKYSYLIKTGNNVETWSNVFNKLVHPAGFIFFGEILLFLNLLRSSLGDNTRQTSFTYTGSVTLPNNTTTFRQGAQAYDSVGNFGNPTTDALEEARVGAQLNVETGEVSQTVKAYGRNNRSTLSSMPGIQFGVIGLEDIMRLVESFVSTFTPTLSAKIFRNGQMSVALSSGSINNIEIVQPGYGYTSAPTLTITGAGGSNAAATCTIDSFGRIDSVTITNAGSGYNSIAIDVASHPILTQTTIDDIFFPGLANKTYRKAPRINIAAPDAVDADGVALSSNVQAVANFVLEATSVEHIRLTDRGSGYTSTPTVTISAPPSGVTAQAYATINNEGKIDGVFVYNAGSGYTTAPTISFIGGGGSGAEAEALLNPSEISSINISNRGYGYTVDPRITLGSSGVTEKRAKDTNMILIILLNYLNSVNNYFNLKGNSFYNSTRKFDTNQRIDLFGDQIIENTYASSINRYNTSSFINIE